MSWLQDLVLGILQGFTEYLPVSSSGHLAICSSLFGIQGADNLTFTIIVHDRTQVCDGTACRDCTGIHSSGFEINDGRIKRKVMKNDEIKKVITEGGMVFKKKAKDELEGDKKLKLSNFLHVGDIDAEHQVICYI